MLRKPALWMPGQADIVLIQRGGIQDVHADLHAIRPMKLERETGIEPATFSLGS